MKKLEDVAMLFHDFADCPGIITSHEDGWLVCAECGKPVGQVEPGLLAQMIDLLSRTSRRPQ